MRGLFVALLFVGCKDSGDDTGDPPAGPTWSVAFDTAGIGDLSGVWGSGPDDVWAVGGFPDEGVAMHYNGTAWTPDAIPAGTPQLVWVHGFGPDDVWAVGLGGTALRKTGGTWTEVETGTTEALWGVWGAASDDVWIVGGDVATGDPMLLHFDGTDITQTPLDAAENDRNARSMFKVWGTDGRVFAVGQNGLIVEWDGTDWTQMSTGAAADQDFVSLWGNSSSDTVAVGGRSSARVATLEGDTWTTVAPSAFPGLNAISVDADTVVGGQFGFVGRWDGAEIVQEQAPVADTLLDVHAIWNDGAGKYYAVGGRFLEPHEGMAWVRETL